MSIPWHAPLERGERVGRTVEGARWVARPVIRVPDDLPALTRYTGHLGLVLLLIAALWGAFPAQSPSSPMIAVADAPPDAAVGMGGALYQVSTQAQPASLQPAILPSTSRSLRGVLMTSLAGPRLATRASVLEYTVQPNDTVYGIASRFGLQEETILWANSALEDDPHMLRIGQVLTLLPVDGVYHTVSSGESIESIAAKYQVEAAAITGYPGNDLSAGGLQAGQQLIVPGGVRPAPPKPTPAPAPPVAVAAAPAPAAPVAPAAPPADAPVGSGQLIYPMAGTLSQRFSAYHRGVDWYASVGTPVFAADAGYVSEVRYSCCSWGCSYGRWIIIDHGNGITTLYAHVDSTLVEPGQRVERGQIIATCGDCGKSTGPHLHFEVKVNGGLVNPYNYLP